MRKIYLRGLSLLVAVVAAAGAMADNAGVKTKAVYTYGAMFEAGYSKTPTGVVRSYYDAGNRLSRVVEADIMLADNDQTLEVEVPGQEIPKLYTIYDYDTNGQLLKKRTRKYGIYSAFDRAWADFVDAEVYEYDADGNLLKMTDATYITTYKWENGNLVEETAHYVKDGAWSNSILYTAFQEGRPTAALFSDTWGNNRVYEYAYDEAGNKVLFAEYKTANAEKDENGVLVKADKGELYAQTTWTYADGVLTEEQKGYWNSGKGEVTPDTKVTYTAAGDTTTIDTYRYYNGNWSVFGSTKKAVSGVVDNATSATGLTVKEVKDAVNTLQLTATAPANAASDGWKVYRNGMLVGEAELGTDGVLTYQDSLVANGTWDYFIQHGDDNTSDVVEKTLATKLAAVGGVKVVKNSLNATGDYELTFVWAKPNTSLEIKGYNVYADVASFTSNPIPENETKLIAVDNATFTFKQEAGSSDGTEHNFYVETVYNIGKARSESIPLVLQKVETPLLKKAVITYGDLMGGAVSDDTPTKAEVYYYDVEGKLQRMVDLSMKFGDESEFSDKNYKVGDWAPSAEVAYDYNEKGQLVNVRKRQYSMYSGYDWCWGEYEETSAFSYDDEGRILEDTTTNRVYHYVYDGDNVVQEIYANSSNVIIYRKAYSHFVEGLTNCPQYAFAYSPYGLQTNDRIYEYTYDKDGNMLSCRSYKYLAGTEVKDDDGNVISAEKGTPEIEELWTYDNGILVKYENNKWNTSKKTYQPKSRTEYTLTPMGTMIVSYSYSVGIWARSGSPRMEINIPYAGVAAADLKVEPVEGKVNTVKLTAKAPVGVSASTVWNVYRNGMKIGQADVKRTDLTYEDELVPNGRWDYFIQAADSHGAEGVNISNVAELDIYTELPAVTDMHVVSNGYNKVQDYEVVLGWTAPQTDLTIEGYHMFVDVKTSNPSPVDGHIPFTETSYTYTAANDVNRNKSFIVETVYNIGKVKSEALAVVLGGTSEGIQAVEVDNLLWISGRTLFVAGEYNALEIYTSTGVKVGAYTGEKRISLSALSAGIYLVRVNTADGWLDGKVAVK